MLTVRAPASSGNLGSGFDAISLALDLCNDFSVERAHELSIETVGEGAEQLATDRTNLAYEAIQRAYQACQRDTPPLRLRCENRIPLSRGLGSSSSAICAGLLLGNRLQGDPLSMDDLLLLATHMEGHPDNVVACMRGGVQVSVLSDERVVHCEVPVNLPLRAVLFVPEFAMNTSEARRLLPRTVGLEDAVFNLGRSALLVAALADGRPELLRVATDDRLHQPPRSVLFPAMRSLFDAALEAGALAACLSGAGSTVLALTSERDEQISWALASVAADNGISGSARIVDIRARGAEFLER